jgi:antitoxin ChpS
LTLTIPKHLVRQLQLAEGAAMALSAEGSKLIAEPVARQAPAYRLEDLLAQCDPGAPLTAEDEAWLSDPAVGDEAI